ncbi:hypothetical protein PInf_016693 [Phytophthora infestans]|nr:hypothetical protein PInf_016693 [Phytophthora infestans]
MVRGLRVKAVVRSRLPAVRRNLCVEEVVDSSANSQSPPHVSSDDEWLDSAVETSSNTSGQSKQGRSEGLAHPRSTRERSGDDHGLEVHALLLDRLELKSSEDLEQYLGEYSKRTCQSFRAQTNNIITARNNKI